MTDRPCKISNLINRVTSCCLTNPMAAGATRGFTDEERDVDEQEKEEDPDKGLKIWEENQDEGDEGRTCATIRLLEKVRGMEVFVAEVFDAISALKKVYVSLQEAHCPWDQDRIRIADAAVVSELRKLGRLRDRFRRCVVVTDVGGGVTPLREVVAPYEAALEDLRRELKVKEADIENLKVKLRSSTTRSGDRRGRLQSTKRVGCVTGIGSLGTPTPELFESCMEQVKAASKSFTVHLLSLMRAARWDLAAATTSMIDGGGAAGGGAAGGAIPEVEPQHARHALESYVNRKLFHGFENETFYLEGSLTSLLRPEEFRRDCYAQFRDLRAMDPTELLGILPTCQFGKFSGKKYLAVVHAKMEESLFGGSEQRLEVISGGHPRTGFYGEFLRLAKAVWLLHLLAFALDPAPSHFEASKGAEFHPDYMESVVSGRATLPTTIVGFSVAPGFKLGNGSVVRARVYLVSQAHSKAQRSRDGLF